jgi:hypothetical protein
MQRHSPWTCWSARAVGNRRVLGIVESGTIRQIRSPCLRTFDPAGHSTSVQHTGRVDELTHDSSSFPLRRLGCPTVA